MIHVFVVAEQLLVHRCRLHRWWGNDSAITKYHQQMPECCAQIATVTMRWAGAVASRKMAIKKFRNNAFVDASQAPTPIVNPLREMGYAT
jgi:hypothetical protein